VEVDDVEPLPPHQGLDGGVEGDVEGAPDGAAVAGDGDGEADPVEAGGDLDPAPAGPRRHHRHVVAERAELLAQVADVLGDAAGVGDVVGGDEGDLHAPVRAAEAREEITSHSLARSSPRSITGIPHDRPPPLGR
jgi:hypothetical protein